MATDIFVQIGQLFRNQTPEGEVPVFVLHRFFVSDPAFAPVAKALAPIWDDKMVVEVWRASLPRMAKPPYFRYAAPKKPPAAVEVVKKIASVECLSLAEAEEVLDLITLMGKGAEVYAHYGVEVSA